MLKALRDDHGGHLHRRFNVPAQRDFNAMLDEQRRVVDKLVERLGAGRIGADEFAHGLDQVILDGHTQAWALGRQLAGDLRPMLGDDATMGAIARDLESPYLQGLLSDLRSGRYTTNDGVFRPDPLNSRLDLYFGKMRGTANEAWVETGPEEAEIVWHLGGVENHCGDCPFLASGSPYIRATLPTQPGKGDTSCLGRCKCYLERDGQKGFEAYIPEAA